MDSEVGSEGMFSLWKPSCRLHYGRGDGRVSEAEKRRSPVQDVCKTKEIISLDERLDIVK